MMMDSSALPIPKGHLRVVDSNVSYDDEEGYADAAAAWAGTWCVVVGEDEEVVFHGYYHALSREFPSGVQ